MPTYLDEKRRRISQFAEHLRLMGFRAHKLAKGSCFIIFDETPPEDAESSKVKESVAIKVDSLTAGGSTSGGPGKTIRAPTSWARSKFGGPIVIETLDNKSGCRQSSIP